MTPLDLGLSVVATGSVGIAFWSGYIADTWKKVFYERQKETCALLNQNSLAIARLMNERDTYRNLLDRKDRRASNKPQPRDSIGRFTTKAHS